MENSQFPFGKSNYLLIAISVALIILGFILMTGPGSTDVAFEPDIFSTRRIVIAPFVCFIGFVMMIVSIMYKSKEKK
ncbi:MAG: DUF3098 domain-containing protein [Bacteroidales bacterium]